jgi:hypothetical protein
MRVCRSERSRLAAKSYFGQARGDRVISATERDAGRPAGVHRYAVDDVTTARNDQTLGDVDMLCTEFGPPELPGL